jgi:hypothetical protein
MGHEKEKGLLREIVLDFANRSCHYLFMKSAYINGQKAKAAARFWRQQVTELELVVVTGIAGDDCDTFDERIVAELHMVHVLRFARKRLATAIANLPRTPQGKRQIVLAVAA